MQEGDDSVAHRDHHGRASPGLAVSSGCPRREVGERPLGLVLPGALAEFTSLLYSSFMNYRAQRRPVELMAILHSATWRKPKSKPSSARSACRWRSCWHSRPCATPATRCRWAAGGWLACVKSNITQLVDRLEADGLVVPRSGSQGSAGTTRGAHRGRPSRVRGKANASGRKPRRCCSGG